MPSTRDIRRRIKSVRNTAQITKAMQMVASSKMQRAQQSAVQGRPFAAMTRRLLEHLSDETRDYQDPMMEVRPVRKRGVIVVSTDKGLCGALNSNLFREAAKFDPASTLFISVGRKAAQFLARTRRKLAGEFTYHDTPTFSECQTVAFFARDLFLKAEVDEVLVLYTRFINTLSQRPDTVTLLPMAPSEPASKPGAEPARQRYDFIFEPDPQTLMERLLIYFLDFQVAQVLLEAKASEHSARMVAMKNATDNAKQLVKELTLEYNKIRQATITKELLEISSAAMALG
ncbi:MAG TPA: ATP synthase F1 subunit gamma [Verrucomicrobiae bacterium]